MPGCDDYDDAGCYICGGLRDTCRLLPPVRWLLSIIPRRKMEYHQMHEYDDIDEWYTEQDREENATKDVLARHGLISEEQHELTYQLYLDLKHIFEEPTKTLKERKKEIRTEERKRMRDRIMPFLPKKYWK